LLSHLVRSMHTAQMLESPSEIILSTHILFSDELDSKAPKKPLAKKVKISQEAIDFLTNKDLFNIVIENNYQEEMFGLALSHLCFDNRKLSKTICLRLLKQIVFSDYDKVKPCIEVVNTLLTIKDSKEKDLQ